MTRVRPDGVAVRGARAERHTVRRRREYPRRTRTGVDSPADDQVEGAPYASTRIAIYDEAQPDHRVEVDGFPYSIGFNEVSTTESGEVGYVIDHQIAQGVDPITAPGVEFGSYNYMVIPADGIYRVDYGVSVQVDPGAFDLFESPGYGELVTQGDGLSYGGGYYVSEPGPAIQTSQEFGVGWNRYIYDGFPHPTYETAGFTTSWWMNEGAYIYATDLYFYWSGFTPADEVITYLFGYWSVTLEHLLPRDFATVPSS